MQIFIKTLTGRKTQFDFESDNTVRHVKEALQEKEGIQVEQIRSLVVFSDSVFNFNDSRHAIEGLHFIVSCARKYKRKKESL